MKVHLIKKETIEEYMVAQARSRPSFEEWLEKIRRADWNKPEDVTATFKSADLLGNGSNIGTHAEYTQLCKKERQYFIDDY